MNDISEFNDIDFYKLLEDLTDKEKKQALLYLNIITTFHNDISLRLNNIEKLLSSSDNTSIVIVEEMNRNEAIVKIKKYMENHNTSDIEELHQELGIPIELLIDIIDQLISDGKIIEG